ncbi:sigma-70 family RNA polymerase sigma factor [Natronosporangium hydrolyticum]|uniref:Sigma-70 family RNA polymerase sigma factor n=1 Tax=Natronosporangium hydrolyticum TaxID=2811111 RepID=A0A895YGD0_9ACTN|nr:sigma-70 family RNA polymerase sigma factor [Natronosporangium hydrolyticum]QSB16877.1 sigma-70 family RNA polymerase sigma factor [Natronosporangium hydrolyticum]
MKGPAVTTSASVSHPTSDMTTIEDPCPDAGSAAALSDGLGWMFGPDAEPATPLTSDDVVGQAVEDLVGDWTRTGGQLTLGDVAMLATKRALSPAQHSEVLRLLARAGVDLPDTGAPGPRRAATPGYELQRDSIGQYLKTIARYPLIDGPREVELWSLISHGDAAQRELATATADDLAPGVRQHLLATAQAGRRAHNELVCANLRLVVSVARLAQYQSSGVEFADRIQDGNLGLMRAADKFDGSKGFKFSTYATWWIRQSIERGIGDRGRTIRIPIHFHEKVQQVKRTISRLTVRLDRDPTLTEIADKTGLSPGTVQFVLDLIRPVVSIDALLGDDGDLHLSDVIGNPAERDGRADPAEIVSHAMLASDVCRAVWTLLPGRAVDVIARRFGLGTDHEETLEAIAADYGVTRERIRQIEGKSLTTLRVSEEAAMLRAYLIDDSPAPRDLVRKGTR